MRASATAGMGEQGAGAVAACEWGSGHRTDGAGHAKEVDVESAN
ncbi:hypothetical protein KCH_20070 [Kitasatospora cheerisanensis KCTC 2395]|uniref:Uncharacterized protein n=1 Tax=Kitasatospora cheerisanensis KCTC 2395 TaxID=1348663 RepID=A0A066Z7S6_9ACTN|nr:hypothetical protein KCH_20070 [Kitasatospora cheerisanensis KCTC 2395]